MAFPALSLLAATPGLPAGATLRCERPPIDLRTLDCLTVAALFAVASGLIPFSAMSHVGASLAALAIAVPPVPTQPGALALGLVADR